MAKNATPKKARARTMAFLNWSLIGVHLPLPEVFPFRERLRLHLFPEFVTDMDVGRKMKKPGFIGVPGL